MKTLHIHDLEMEKRIKTWYKNLPQNPDTASTWLVTSKEVISLVETELKQLYIKIAEGELARLKENFVSEDPEMSSWHRDNAHGYNEALTEEISHWTNILQELNK